MCLIRLSFELTTEEKSGRDVAGALGRHDVVVAVVLLAVAGTPGASVKPTGDGQGMLSKPVVAVAILTFEPKTGISNPREEAPIDVVTVVSGPSEDGTEKELITMGVCGFNRSIGRRPLYPGLFAAVRLDFFTSFAFVEVLSSKSSLITLALPALMLKEPILPIY